jgi:hypothetical protein
VEVKLPYQK